MKVKRKLIVIKDIRKDKNIEIRLNFVKTGSPDNKIFLNPKNETAPKIGIESKKDILAASTLLNFKILAAVIAIPDLLTPGIKEKI
tara:strand:+ start:133 stop:390 length:258 start_codon:yes stop_codon:yes gene_type:complete